MKKPSLEFVIPGKPKSKENNYFTRKRSKNLYVPKEIQDWECEVHSIAIVAMKEAGWEGPWTGRVTIAADFCFSSWHERDIQNYWKSLSDALNGAVYDDDSQIDRDFQCRQKSTDDPHIKVFVWFHDFDLGMLGKKRPREWADLTCEDMDFPDTYPIVTDPKKAPKRRMSKFGAGRKVEERELAKLKKAKGNGKKKQAPRKRKARSSSKKGNNRRR